MVVFSNQNTRAVHFERCVYLKASVKKIMCALSVPQLTIFSV